MEAPKRKYLKHKKSVKITVKHQLNTSAPSYFDNVPGEIFYPLYVTVSVNRQFTRFKSRFRQLLTVGDFEAVLNMPNHLAFLENERAIIQDSVSQFKPEQKDEFKLTEWSRYYERGLVDISHRIDLILYREIESLLHDKYQWHVGTISALPAETHAALSIMALLGIKEADSMIEYYGPTLKIDIYETALRIKSNLAHTYCVWDIKSGYYQRQLTLLLGQNAEMINSRLQEIFASGFGNDDAMDEIEKLFHKNIPE